MEEIEIKNNIKNKISNMIKEFAPFIAIIVIVLLIKQFIVTPVQVNGASMDPTLANGDIMILNKISYKIHGINRFDIVVIRANDTLLIKRIIGLPNETVKVEDNKLYINGEEIEQDFLSEDELTNNFETTVKEDCYFVLGDNRNLSLDSRSLGCFKYEDILGTTSLTIFPFNRIGNK